ncbi:MAG: hypothetical protein D6772_16810 [Bacteroidetes bacterium]|nr:MAG: hypothetical protein D6772_16810 [Bacteroidota bacterium]
MSDENHISGFDALRLALIGAIVMAVLLLVLRVLGPYRFAILAFLVVVTLAYGLWSWWQYLHSRRRAKAWANTTAARIQQQLDRSRAAWQAHQEAITQLLRSQQELRRSARAAVDDAEQLAAKTSDLIADYAQEIALREQKLRFYEQIIHQLESLAAQHEWLATLQAKETELAQFQEQRARDAEQEADLRRSLLRETERLQKLDKLSEQLESTNSLESAEKMRESLKELLV